MMTVLREQNVSGLDLDRVLVEVYPASPAYKDSQQFARDLFVEVNKAEPVKWVDMPGVASTADRDVINQAADWLHSQFRPMFSASQNCRVPHVHLDTTARCRVCRARIDPPSTHQCQGIARLVVRAK